MSKGSQFLAIENPLHDEMFPKYLLREYLSKREAPDFSLPEYKNTPYALFADLDLKIYITTNYDLLMEEALKSRNKDPVSEFCRWNNYLLEIPSSISKHSKYKPEKPLVFHLHGDVNTPQSMVLTEKDYFDFIINFNKEDEKRAIT